MRAAYITEPGPPEAIRVGELPVPGPGPTDVLVRVEVVVVDPVDTMVRSGAYRTPTPLPFVVGRDLVGTVAVLHPAATAYLALFRHGGLRPTETLYVGGAAGNVGTALTSLARAGGARVLAGARPEDAGWCRAAGAAEVVDYRDPDLAGRLAALAPDGIDLYVDTSGHLDLPAAIDLLADRGRIVLVAGGGQRLTLPAGPLYTHDRSILGFVISLATTAELAEAAAVLNDRLAAGGPAGPGPCGLAAGAGRRGAPGRRARRARPHRPADRRPLGPGRTGSPSPLGMLRPRRGRARVRRRRTGGTSWPPKALRPWPTRSAGCTS